MTQYLPVLALFAVLAGQFAVFHSLPQQELVPIGRPLKEFPAVLGQWRSLAEFPVDPEVQAVLQADDTMSRSYGAAGRPVISLFVAFFKSQRSGVAPHSPKNCLPGSGWAALDNSIVPVSLGGGREIEVNRFVVAKGDQKSLVLYWYQSRGQVVASEYKAKVQLVLDSIRYNRSDTALVRLVIPLQQGMEDESERAALEFLNQMFDPLSTYLPA